MKSPDPHSSPECPHLTVLAGLLDDTLSDANREQTELHLGECTTCQERLSELAIDSKAEPHLARLLRPVRQLSDRESEGELGDERAAASFTLPGLTLRAELGRGGAGVVYEAFDNELRRPVAIKVLNSSEREHEIRFRAEAEAAAQLQHPNIIEVFTCGVHRERMYLVMELVDGGDLSHFLREHQLSARESAQLLEVLSRTMAYAHRKGVLHRDLKPANVLLFGQEQYDAGKCSERNSDSARSLVPKISDFGLAAWTSQSAGPTVTGQLLGTPHYMSPEQALGEPGWATVKTDIYSLGAILYECLTGVPPHRGQSTADTLRLVTSEDPVSPRKHNSSIPFELETICLKCLEKDPSSRYETAEDLADDIGRFLNNQTIIARPASTLRRAKKWLRRRTMWVVVGVAMMLVLGAAMWSAIAVQRERAELVLQTAESQKNYFLAKEAVAAILDLQGSPFELDVDLTPAQQRTLEKARTLFISFSQVQTDDYEVMIQQAETLKELTRVELFIDLREESLETANEAIVLYRRLLATHPDSVDLFDGLTDCLRMKGMIARQLSDYEQSYAAFDEAIERLNKIVLDDRDLSEQFILRHSSCLFGRGWTHLRQRDWDSAINDYAASRHLTSMLLAESPQDARFWREDGRVSHQMGLANLRAGRRDQGIALLKESLHARGHALAIEPINPQMMWAKSISLIVLATTEFNDNDKTDVDAYLKEAHDLLLKSRELAPHSHRIRKWQGVLHSRNGALALLRGDTKLAEVELQNAYEICDSLAFEFPHIYEYVEDFFEAAVALRKLYEQRNEVSLLLPIYERGLSLRQEVISKVGVSEERVLRLAVSQSHYAEVLWNFDLEQQAVSHAQAAIVSWQQALALENGEELVKKYLSQTGSAASLFVACSICWSDAIANEEQTDIYLTLGDEVYRELLSRPIGKRLLEQRCADPVVQAFVNLLEERNSGTL